MADQSKVIQMIQLQIGNSDANYKPAIEYALEEIWALVAKYRDWWFLAGGTPLSIPLVANQSRYTIEKAEVGRMRFLADVNGTPVAKYLDQDEYEKEKTDQTDLSGEDPSVFTIVGSSEGNPVIEVSPTPGSSTTLYLHYREAGTLANLTALPIGWGKVLIHGAKSMLARPEKIPHDLWQAITFKEDQMFQYWLKEMGRLEGNLKRGPREPRPNDLEFAQLQEVEGWDR
jgi:hypothetical protein